MLIDVGGKLINTAQVLWIERAETVRGTPRSSIRFASGDTLTVSADLAWIARQQDSIVPAPAGYQAVRASLPHSSDEDRSVSCDVVPVIAFRFRGESNTILDPITPEGVPGDHFAIVGPDGRCWDIDRDYENVDAYKQSFSEDWARDHARDGGKAA